MPATALELFHDRTEQTALDRKQVSTAQVPWLVRNAVDEADAYQAILGESDVLIGGLVRKTIEVTERLDATTWKGVVRYEGTSQEDQDKKDQTAPFSFDTGGGTAHITQSLKTINKIGTPKPEDFDGAIGFDGTNVQGVDIAVPVFNFSYDVQMSLEEVTGSYMRLLYDTTGKVNSDPFHPANGPAFSAGEVLFLGVSGARGEPQGTTDKTLPQVWKLNFRFSAQPNLKNLNVGKFTIPEKKGWEYVWVLYGKALPDSPAPLIQRPVAVYVEQVYKSAKFSLLGIK